MKKGDKSSQYVSALRRIRGSLLAKTTASFPARTFGSRSSYYSSFLGTTFAVDVILYERDTKDGPPVFLDHPAARISHGTEEKKPVLEDRESL